MANAEVRNLDGTRSYPAAWLWNAGIVLAGSAFLAICSHLTLPLPWTPVPLNLQPFGVLLLALLFGPNLGAATAALYLLEGATGLPVFSPHGPGGLVQLLGPTGGYLLSYPLAAWVTGRLALSNQYLRSSFFISFGAALAGDVLVLTAGTAWLAILTHASLRPILLASFFPFLPGDFLKCVAAAGIATGCFVWRRSRD
jgi:biotin transport system substrate-specific component